MGNATKNSAHFGKGKWVPTFLAFATLLLCGMSTQSDTQSKIEDCLVVVRSEAAEPTDGLTTSRLEYLSLLQVALLEIEAPVLQVDIGYRQWNWMKFQFLDQCKDRFSITANLLNHVRNLARPDLDFGMEFQVSQEPLSKSDRIIGVSGRYSNILIDDVFEEDFGCRLEALVEFQDDLDAESLGEIIARITKFDHKYLLPLEGVQTVRQLPKQARSLNMDFYMISACDGKEALVSDIIQLSISDAFPTARISFPIK